VLSWVIGTVSILLLAFVFAELSTMFPNSGAMVHMAHVSHGDLVGKIWSWILFLAFVSVPPVEVSAVLTYANNYIPGLIEPHTGLMTGPGMAWAAVLLAGVVALNFLSVRWVLAINNVTTWWKLVIPIVTIGILMAYSFHPSNMVAHAASTPKSGRRPLRAMGWREAWWAIPYLGAIWLVGDSLSRRDVAGELSRAGRRHGRQGDDRLLHRHVDHRSLQPDHPLARARGRTGRAGRAAMRRSGEDPGIVRRRIAPRRAGARAGSLSRPPASLCP
jgi:hypothetical protein